MFIEDMPQHHNQESETKLREPKKKNKKIGIKKQKMNF